jgi:glutamyl-Q tRNA(Asp) synthetase
VDVDFEALRRRLPPNPLTRFAPSPTGYLHLGHVVHAMYVWRLARAVGGRVLLRIEDHDRLRSRPEFERALLDDLEWLGFQPDLGPVRQSDEPRAYEDALHTLAVSQRVYACDCSRRDIAAAAERDGIPSSIQEVPYSGRCRGRGLAPEPGRGLRVHVGSDTERFVDARLGLQEQTPALQCGDILLKDRDTFWTYQFAVTVDDVRQGVDLVIRGADLLSSTGRQIHLARMLGRAHPPVFCHHDLLLDADGLKLSKSKGDTGVRELRARGLAAADVLELAANSHPP